MLKQKLLEVGLTEFEYDALYAKLATEANESKEVRLEIIKATFGAPLMVIFDGYDEAFTEENLFIKEDLGLWCARAFISCRRYAVNPMTMHDQFGDDHHQLMTAYLQPFTIQEVEEDIEKYEKISFQQLDMEVIKKIADTSLIKNPLLLSIAVQFWDRSKF